MGSNRREKEGWELGLGMKERRESESRGKINFGEGERRGGVRDRGIRVEKGNWKLGTVQRERLS